MRSIGPIAVLAGVFLSLTAVSPAGSVGEELPDLSPVPRYLRDRSIQFVGGEKLLRFSNGTGNFGEGPLEVRGVRANPTDPMIAFQRIYLSGGGSIDVAAGTFSYEVSHGHWHFTNYMRYELLNPNGSLAASTEKAGFCLLDVERTRLPLPGSPPGPVYFFCNQGNSTARFIGPQGISRGWIDVYSQTIEGQSIEITDLARGVYILRVTVDPLDRIRESNEDNNTLSLPVFIP